MHSTMRVCIVCLPVCGTPWWVLLQHSIMLRLLFIVECGIVHFLCTMRVFEVRASSSSTRLPLWQISFLSQPPLLSYPTEKNCILNQSLNHSPNLFDPREPKLALLNKTHIIKWNADTEKSLLHQHRDWLWARLWSLVRIETVWVLMHAKISQWLKLFVALVASIGHLVLVKSDVFQKRVELLKIFTTRFHHTLVHLNITDTQQSTKMI